MLKNVLVFSDLDGTLLDHHTYNFAPALPMLHKLRSANIPVIPNTSKTFAELTELRQQIGLDGPFIVENGAAIFIPLNYFATQPADTVAIGSFWVKEFAKPRAHWLSLLEQIKPRFAKQFNHFNNMSNEQIMAATGLTNTQAQLATTREYSEPILWLANETVKAEFVQAVQGLEGTTLQGGRFLHLCDECDKGKALHWLTEQFQLDRGTQQSTTIALGDGQNDVAMLEAADIAVRIASPANAPPTLSKHKHVYTSQAYGPIGWAESLAQIIFNHSQLTN